MNKRSSNARSDVPIQSTTYKILYELGKGNFGTTYKAEMLKGDKIIIVTIKETIIDDDNSDEMFEKLDKIKEEAKTLEYLSRINVSSSKYQIGHSYGIPEFYDFFVVKKNNPNPKIHCYIVYQYIEGETLEKLIKSNRLNDEKNLLRLMDEMLETLTLIHHAGYAHRDIKPENIIVTFDVVNPNLYFIDFGSACTQSCSFVSDECFNKCDTMPLETTPKYISPYGVYNGKLLKTFENFKKMDVWALGVTFYAMANNGNYPFYLKNLRNPTPREVYLATKDKPFKKSLYSYNSDLNVFIDSFFDKDNYYNNNYTVDGFYFHFLDSVVSNYKKRIGYY